MSLITRNVEGDMDVMLVVLFQRDFKGQLDGY